MKYCNIKFSPWSLYFRPFDKRTIYNKCTFPSSTSDPTCRFDEDHKWHFKCKTGMETYTSFSVNLFPHQNGLKANPWHSHWSAMTLFSYCNLLPTVSLDKGLFGWSWVLLAERDLNLPFFELFILELLHKKPEAQRNKNAWCRFAPGPSKLWKYQKKNCITDHT